jgi:flagellar hook-associated protein 1 FlgK
MNIGAGALITQQRAINVAGNNIANVNTPGYSRQHLTMQTGIPTASALGPVGFGVRSTGIERAYDRYLGAQVVVENANLGRWEARQGMLERVEVVLDESDGYGLNYALSEFWNAWQDLGLNPSGQTEREVTAAAGQTLADTIRSKYADLEQVQVDIDVAVEGAVEDVNRLAAEIAELNRKIGETEVGGVNANDYRDSRDLLLKQLAEVIDISSFEDAGGGAVVSVGNGRVLVESGNVSELSTRKLPGSHAEVLWPAENGGWTDITGELSAGKIGGWLEVRDEIIAGYQGRLDDLADGLSQEINNLHGAGRDLNGELGLDFFENAGAGEIEMNPAILADSNLIAAASSAVPAAPGDATNALAIAGLRTALTMGGTATFDDAVNSLISMVGYDTRESKAQARHQADMLTYLENYRESVSGVSLDEEMVDLVKYQAAYDAAAKVISMADEMLNNLMNMVR